MDSVRANRILSETAYIKISGTPEERRCAEYLQAACGQMGLHTMMQPFPVMVYRAECDRLVVAGRSIPCAGYYGCESGTVTGKLCYLDTDDPTALKNCWDRIVLLDGAMSRDRYDQLIESGAKGFITYCGTPHLSDQDIDRKWLDFETEEGKQIPGVTIHAGEAVRLADLVGSDAEITLSHTSSVGQSRNVILDLEGDTEETIVVSAHYDSTPLSVGAYDNMSGCIALLYLAEYFSTRPHRRRIRLLWCGSEEPGLLGSLAYCRENAEDLKKAVLNINLDMLGCTMGEFVAFSCANEEMGDFLREFLKRKKFPASVRYGIRASDSNSFVHYGVPAVSFARYAPAGMAPIHTRYDTAAVMSVERLLKDAKIIAEFTEYMANEPEFPFPVSISEKIRCDVAAYMKRRPRTVR